MSESHTGNKGSAYVDESKIAELKEFSLDLTAGEIEASNLDSEWDKFKTGAKNGSGTIIARFDPTDSAAQGAMVLGGEIELDLYPFGNEQGKLYFNIPKALITGVSMGLKRNELIEKSFTFKVNGDFQEKTVPAP